MDTYRFVTKIKTTALFLSLFLVFGCDQLQPGDSGEENSIIHDGKNLNVHFAIPKALAGAIIGNLQAEVKLNSAEPIQLTVNADNTISGSLPEVNPGNYLITITYYVQASSLKTILASASKNIEVESEKQTVVIFLDSDLVRDMDDDEDGSTNLAEVRAGTDPHNGSSHPIENPQFSVADASSGFASSNSFRITHKAGEAVVGDASSTNYQIRIGFER